MKSLKAALVGPESQHLSVTGQLILGQMQLDKTSLSTLPGLTNDGMTFQMTFQMT